MLWPSLFAAALNVAAAGDITMPVSHSVAPVAEPSTPEVGGPAPDFDYQSYDYRWMQFHNMLQRDAIVMVFSPDDATLSGLEVQRETLAAHGLAPVAVFTHRDDDVWRIATQLKLSYSLLADPHGTIAEGFGLGNGSGELAPTAWFVIGGDGKIRACGRGTLRANALAAAALEAMGVTPQAAEPPSAAN